MGPDLSTLAPGATVPHPRTGEPVTVVRVEEFAGLTWVTGDVVRQVPLRDDHLGAGVCELYVERVTFLL